MQDEKNPPTAKEFDFTFDEAKHEYRLDGNVIPSVTQLLRFANSDVAQFANRYARDAAADKGRRIHEECLIYDYTEEPCADPFLAPYVNSYADFVRDYKPEWILSEVPILGWSDNTPYGGTVDRYGIIDSEFCVVDIKTGTSGNYKSYLAQCAAYAKALENHRRLVNRIGILVLTPDEYVYREYSRTSMDFYYGESLFKECISLDFLMKEGKKYGK